MTIQHFWILNIVLFLGQLLLLLVLAWRKKIIQKKEHDMNHQYQQLLDPFSSYMIDSTDDQFLKELRMSPYQSMVLERLLNGFVSVTKNSECSPLVTQLSEEFLTNRYTKQLTSRSWAIRMNTLYFIEDFHMKKFVPLLKERLLKMTRLDQEKQQLLRTLSSLGEPVTISILEEHPEASVRLYIDLIKRLPLHTRVQQLDAVFFATNEHQHLKYAAISYIGMTGFRQYLPQIELELQNEDEETRIQALKAILQMQQLSEPHMLIPFLHSSSWQERMFATRIVGKLQLSRFKEDLSKLLGDPIWWVRYSSAEAFAQFSDGDVMLTHLATSHPDRYARDMATQWETSLLGSEQ